MASQEGTPRAELAKALDLAAPFPRAGLVMNKSTDVRGKYAYGYGYGVNPTPRG